MRYYVHIIPVTSDIVMAVICIFMSIIFVAVHDGTLLLL